MKVKYLGPKNIKWKTTATEMKLINKIANKALGLLSKERRENIDKISLLMDITACHLNGTPLDLEKLLKADDFNLAHNVFGISNHINRENGKLTRGFLPRCANNTERKD